MASKDKILLGTIAVMAVIIFFSIKGCNENQSAWEDYNTLLDIHLRDSTELVKKTNALGQVTVTAEAFALSQKALDEYVAQNADLKKKLANSYHHVGSVSTTTSVTKIDTLKIPVPIHDTIPCGDIEKNYPVLDRYYSFNFSFKNKQGKAPEFLFTNFSIPDTCTQVIGVKKSGFLNLKRTLVSEQTHTNKYIQITGVQTIVAKEAKPKTLQKILIGFGLGVAAAIYVESKINP
jgi:hypothetical protein